MSDASDIALRAFLDRAAVRDLIIRFANAFDRQDWSALRDCLAAEVHTDYSAFRGEPPATVAADAFVEARATGLAGVRTQQLSTNHEVILDGDRAECYSAFVVHRVAPNAPPGADTFDTAGHYWHACVRTITGWRIDRIKQTILWTRGTPSVHGAFRVDSLHEPRTAPTTRERGTNT
jgi:hypothetical protein